MSSDSISSADGQDIAPRQPALKKALDILKYPIAAVSGYLIADSYAKDSVYNALVKRDAALKDAHAAHVAPGSGNAGTKKFMSEVSGHDGAFRKEINAAFERNGYEKPWHFVQGLGKAQRWRTAGKFLSASSIALGVTMTIADNKTLMKKFSRQDESPETTRS